MWKSLALRVSTLARQLFRDQGLQQTGVDKIMKCSDLLCAQVSHDGTFLGCQNLRAVSTRHVMNLEPKSGWSIESRQRVAPACCWEISAIRALWL